MGTVKATQPPVGPLGPLGFKPGGTTNEHPILKTFGEGNPKETHGTMS
jgi:hypothetical protein